MLVIKKTVVDDGIVAVVVVELLPLALLEIKAVLAVLIVVQWW